jgi:hypothetical protein
MARATGRCICGAVAFDIDGPLREVALCHCTECRRWAGHAWAATEARFDDLRFTEARGLRWIDSPDSEFDARRGFCAECGSSLFWQVPGSEDVSIGVGCLDEPTGVRIDYQVWISSAGDYYEVDEGIRAYERGSHE